MRKLVVATIFALLLALIAPVQAMETHVPDWAGITGAPQGFNWGPWFECNEKYRTDECIDSVYWVKSDGTKVKGTFIPNPRIDYATYDAVWEKKADGTDAQYFKYQGLGQLFTYSFEGLVTPCKDNRIGMNVNAATWSFQVAAYSTCGNSMFFTEKIEEQFEVTLKSKFLKGFVGGISSNGKNPQLSFEERDGFQYLMVSSRITYIPWNDILGPGADGFANICEKNEYRARSGGWGMWISIFWIKASGDTYLAQNPADLMGSSNGWNCGGRIAWDAQEKALVMQVGAPHYDVDGSVVEGWFEGKVRGRYLTSRFGIKPEQAAGNARLEIVYNNGEKKIATIVAMYNKATDWVSLNGYGFTYSSPKLLIKFDNPVEELKPDVNSTDKTPVAAAVPQKVLKKVTITCRKGKTTKKVVAVNPKCPAGYKKA